MGSIRDGIKKRDPNRRKGATGKRGGAPDPDLRSVFERETEHLSYGNPVDERDRQREGGREGGRDGGRERERSYKQDGESPSSFVCVRMCVCVCACCGCLLGHDAKQIRRARHKKGQVGHEQKRENDSESHRRRGSPEQKPLVWRLRVK